jgi:hypothetical protein
MSWISHRFLANAERCGVHFFRACKRILESERVLTMLREKPSVPSNVLLGEICRRRNRMLRVLRLDSPISVRIAKLTLSWELVLGLPCFPAYNLLIVVYKKLDEKMLAFRPASAATLGLDFFRFYPELRRFS